MKTTISRRQLLRTTAIAATPPFARILGANDDIRVGHIGLGSNTKIGGQGRRLMSRSFSKMPGVRVVALCDPDSANLGFATEELGPLARGVETYADMRKMLERKDIDAITAAPPNHWHSLATIWSCQAGKDVYCEKPASHNLFEGRKMVEAARKHNRIVQTPHGRRGNGGVMEALAWAHAGNLGEPLLVRGLNYRARMSIGKVSGPQAPPPTLDYDLWCGPSPKVPVERKNLHYDWHWDFRFGDGDLGNMGIHNLDGCRMAAGQHALPERVVSVGGRFGYDDDGSTPNTLVTFYDYNPVPVIFEVRGLPANRAFRDINWNRAKRFAMDSYYGVQIGVILHCEDGYIAQNQAFDGTGRLIKTFESDRDQQPENFIKAVRSRNREELYSDVEEGYLSSGLIHIANISYRLGEQTNPGALREVASGQADLAESLDRLEDHLFANRVDRKRSPVTTGPALTFDPAMAKFTGALSVRANKIASPEYRAPFVVPSQV